MTTDMLQALIETAKKYGYRITDYSLESKDRVEIGMNKEKK